MGKWENDSAGVLSRINIHYVAEVVGNTQILIRAAVLEQAAIFAAVKSIVGGFLARSHQSYPLFRLADGEVLIQIAPQDEFAEAIVVQVGREIRQTVYAFSCSPDVDAFAYWHYRGKKLLRHLKFGGKDGTRTWNAVAGQPEAWETDVFFSEEEMYRQLQDAKTHFPAQIPEIKRMYTEPGLKLGSRYPRLRGTESLRILQALGWPGQNHPLRVQHQEVLAPERRSWWDRLLGG